MKTQIRKSRLSMFLSSVLTVTCILSGIPVHAISSRAWVENNIALGCSYVASASANGSYPDSGEELTDGKLESTAFMMTNGQDGRVTGIPR